MSSSLQETIEFKKEPGCLAHVPEKDKEMLKQIAKALLTIVFPAQLKWFVLTHEYDYMVGVHLPDDFHVTAQHLSRAGRITTKVVKSWVQYDKCMQLCCKISKIGTSVKPPTKKRKFGIF